MDDDDFSQVGAAPAAKTVEVPVVAGNPAAAAAAAAADDDFSQVGLPGVSEPKDKRPVTSDSFEPIHHVKPNQEWGETLVNMPANIPSSAAKTAAGVYGGVKQGIMENSPGAVLANTAGALSGDQGAKDRLANSFYGRSAAALADAYKNPAGAVDYVKKAAGDFGNKWFTSEGLKKNFGEDPVGGVMDLASVVQPAFRGARALMAPSAAGLENSAKFAATLGRTNLGLSPADLTPEHYDAIARNIGQKGYTPAAVQEAVMQSSTGVPPPRGAASGYAPVAGGEDAARTRSQAGAAAAGERLQDIAGAPRTPADLGQDWHDARAAAGAETDRLYTDWRREPGVIAPGAMQYIRDSVQHAAGVSDPRFFDSSYATATPATATTQAALNEFHDQLTKPPPGRNVDLQHIDNLRRRLREVTQGENPADHRIVEGAIGGLDNSISQVVQQPHLFSESANGPAINQKLLDARAAHAYEQTHFGREAPPEIRAANGALDASSAPDLHKAGTILENALNDRAKGPGIYNHLASAGMTPIVDDHMRNRLLGGNTASIDTMLNSPVGQQVFHDPVDRANIMTTNASRRAFEAKHGTPAPHSITDTAMRIAKPAAAAAATGAGMHFFGHEPLMAGTLGLLGGAAEAAHERFFSGAPARVELSGARANLGNRVANTVQPALDAAAAANVARHAESREPHAKGGRVGHQHLVDRLFSHVEKAKKAEKDRTSVLLNHPDEHIAKALNIAQAAI